MGESGPDERLTVRGAGGARELLVQRFELTIFEGPDAGRSLRSDGERLTIGTHESSGLRLTDRTVSRFHCELTARDGRVVVRDLESRNGTFVDDVSVLEANVHPGAVLRCGDTRIRFAAGSDAVPIALSEAHSFGGMVGRSPVMRATFALLERAAASNVTVLLEGETGTGKEAAAEGIHLSSARRDQPFIVVDCSAIPPSLIESELFGHERGAFTGAVAARAGAFEAAAGGTLFIDEVGELALELQPKLLRALERREVKRVGSNQHRAVDVRVIAATNRSLRAEVNSHRFRSDLYYRLAVLEVRLPPLRERAEDQPLLVEKLLAGLGAGDHPAAAALRAETFCAELGRHPWPGNVRELRNYLERCLVLQSPPPIPAATSARAEWLSAQPLRAARDAFERQYLEDCVKRCGDNLTEVSRVAGLDRSQIYRLLWKHGLRR